MIAKTLLVAPCSRLQFCLADITTLLVVLLKTPVQHGLPMGPRISAGAFRGAGGGVMRILTLVREQSCSRTDGTFVLRGLSGWLPLAVLFWGLRRCLASENLTLPPPQLLRLRPY